MPKPPPGSHSSDFTEDWDFYDLAALDLPAADMSHADSELSEILGDYPSSDAYPDSADSEASMPMFTVTNPPGTVTVTTYIDGSVHDVELSAGAATLSEVMLADEIVVIAGLATQDARSAQYTMMLDGMREQGHDSVATRDFLARDLNLPTPEQARTARAELFMNRYIGDHD